jgi:Deoxyribonuclease NucA/NucB
MRRELPLAVAELRRLLTGLADPAAGLRFINTLVQAAAEVRDWADDVKDGRFLRALVELGVTVLRVNPTVNLADGTATAEWLEAGLSGDVKGMAQGLSEFAEGLGSISLATKAVEFATRLVKAADAVTDPLLDAQVLRSDFLSHLLNLGGAYAALDPLPILMTEDPKLFLNTLWTKDNLAGRTIGTNEFYQLIRNSANPKHLVEIFYGILYGLKIAKIEGISSDSNSIKQLFDIAKLIDTNSFSTSTEFPKVYASLVSGLFEIQKPGNQPQLLSYESQIRDLVLQLSQGTPDVSAYVNNAEDPDAVLVASSGDLATFPGEYQENLRLKQEPNYDAVVVRRDLKMTFFDYAVSDGDTIDIYLNGSKWLSAVELFSNSWTQRPIGTSPLTVTLPKNLMQPGENVLEIRSLNQGRVTTTVGVDFEENRTIYGKWRHTAAIPVGGSTKITFGLPKIRVNGTAYAYSADHIIDVLQKPRIFTIDRPGNNGRRAVNLARYKEIGGIETIEGAQYQRDEAPPAVFAESIKAHVRLIPESDNTGSGSQIGRAITFYGSSKINLKDGWNVDFFATIPTIPTPNRVSDVPIDWEYKIL